MLLLLHLLLGGVFVLLFDAPSSSGLHCHNQFDIQYGTLENFTDHMCLYCLDTMILPTNEPVWRNVNVVNQWKIDIVHKGNLIFHHQGTHRLKFRELEEAVMKRTENQHFVLKEFASQFYINTFLDCCQDAYDCCRRMEKNPTTSEHHCPTLWDGWNCWESAPPGQELQTCPDMTEYLFGYLPARFARNNCINQCDSNGQWHKRWNPYYQRWMGHADYTQCSHLKIR